MSVNIKYKNNSITELSDTGTKTLKTAGKYCEGDIIACNQLVLLAVPACFFTLYYFNAITQIGIYNILS